MIGTPLVSTTVMMIALALSSAANAQSLFFSEYVEGTANNRGLELYNPGLSAVDLGAQNYSLRLYVNGDAAPTTTLSLTGIVPVIAHSAATFAGSANQIFSSLTFNGDDAIALVRNNVEVDVIGQEGFDPGQGWGTGSQSTLDRTLRRRPHVCFGDSNGLNDFTPNLDPVIGEWNSFPLDAAGGLGGHSVTCSTCPADIAQNGVVNVNDLLAVINAWGSCPGPPFPCPADLAPNGGNGTVNVNDLLAVINAWGPCPQ